MRMRREGKGRSSVFYESGYRIYIPAAKAYEGVLIRIMHVYHPHGIRGVMEFVGH